MTTVQGQANRAWPGVPRWAGSLVVGLVLGAAGPVAAVAQEAPLGRDLPGLLNCYQEPKGRMLILLQMPCLPQ